MCLHCLGTFAQVRKVMMGLTAAMFGLVVVYGFIFLIVMITSDEPSGPEEMRPPHLRPLFTFLDLVGLALWITYLVYMSGVLNRLPKGRGYKVLGAELFRIFGGIIIDRRRARSATSLLAWSTARSTRSR